MGILTEAAQWVADIFKIETDTVWKGGDDGDANKQGQALANRTLWLKGQVEALGNDKQPLDATLTALAAIVTVADRLIYTTGPDAFAQTPLSAFIRTLLDDADAATARATLGAISQAQLDAAIAALVNSSPGALDTLNELAAALGNDPNFSTTVLNSLAGKAALAAQNAFSSGNHCTEKPLPATTGNVALDLAAGVNFGGQLTGNITLTNPTGMQPGQSGVIRIANDAATPRTIAYGSYWKTPGGTMPALTAVAGAVDVFGYYVESASRITLVQQADSK